MLTPCNLTLTKCWSDNLDCDDMWIKFDIDVWAKDIYIHQAFDTMISTFKQFGEEVVQISRKYEGVLDFTFKPFSPESSQVEFCIEPPYVNISIILPESMNPQYEYSLQILAQAQMLEDFGHGIKRLASGGVGDSRRLNPNLPARCIPVEEVDFPYNRLYGE